MHPYKSGNRGEGLLEQVHVHDVQLENVAPLKNGSHSTFFIRDKNGGNISTLEHEECYGGEVEVKVPWAIEVEAGQEMTSLYMPRFNSRMVCR